MSYKGTGRAPAHDYTSVSIYHITIRKRSGIKSFANIIGDPALPLGTPGAVSVMHTPLGLIVRNTIYRIPTQFPHIRVWQWCVMPDHVHILLYVTEAGHEHLSQIIGWYKKEVNNCARQNIYHGKNLGEVVRATDEGSGIFIRNYNDQIIYRERSVDTVIQYIKMNPWRRAVIRAHPNYFSTLTQITLNGILYQAYGNLQLLQCPFMDQVVVHRADDAATRLRHRDRWLHTAMNGGVLASAWISPDEKRIRDEAAACGGRIIKIQRELMGPHDKAQGADFALCSAGRMLILIPLSLPDPTWRTGKRIQRGCALHLNSLAGRLCSCTGYAEHLAPKAEQRQALCVACKLGSGPELNLHSSGFFCTFAR